MRVTHSKTLVAPDSGTEDKVYGVDYVATDSHTLDGVAAFVDFAGPTAARTYTLPDTDATLATASDLTGYALLAGRTTGQTLTGGTAASETLTLRSTSHATKGKLLFGTSAYDEVNNRLGIGTTSPSHALVVGSSNQFTVTTAGVLTTASNGTIGGTLIVGTPQSIAGSISFSNSNSSANKPYVANSGAGALKVHAFSTGGSLAFGANAGIVFGVLTTSDVFTQQATLTSAGLFGIGLTPTAILHLKAGTATANTAPFKFTTGTLNTTAEVGAMEYNNTPWFTNSDAVRRSIVLSDGTYTAGAVAVGGTVKMNINGTDYNVHVS